MKLSTPDKISLVAVVILGCMYFFGNPLDDSTKEDESEKYAETTHTSTSNYDGHDDYEDDSDDEDEYESDYDDNESYDTSTDGSNDSSQSSSSYSAIGSSGQTHPQQEGCTGDSFNNHCFYSHRNSGSSGTKTENSNLPPVPYVGMSENDINNTQCGSYTQSRHYSTKNPRFSNSYTLYDWYTNGKDIPLIVECKDGVVTDVSKYDTDKFWNGDIPRW